MKEKGCYESLGSLLLETNISLQEESSKESLFLQRLVLQGRWEDLLRYLKPLLEEHASSNPHLHSQVHYLIMKQRLLETLSYQGGGGERWIFPPWKPSYSHGVDLDRVELEDIMEQINALKPYCTVQVRFDEMYFF